MREKEFSEWYSGMSRTTATKKREQREGEEEEEGGGRREGYFDSNDIFMCVSRDV